MNTALSRERALCARIDERHLASLDDQEELTSIVDSTLYTCRCSLGDAQVVVVYEPTYDDDEVIVTSVVIQSAHVHISAWAESQRSSWHFACARDLDAREQLKRIGGVRRAA